MASNLPDGVQVLSVRLAYQDLHAALRFLDEAFGFPERREKRLEGAAGSILVAEVQVGDAYLMLGGSGPHGLSSPQASNVCSASLMVYVDEIDAHFARAKAHGATIIAEPADQYWGDRRYEVLDPEGHRWFFHERTREVSREEIERIEAGFRAG